MASPFALKEDVAEIDTRVTVVERELEHGTTIFHRLEGKLDSLDARVREHMGREERLLIRVGGGLILALGSTVMALTVYIWNARIG